MNMNTKDPLNLSSAVQSNWPAPAVRLLPVLLVLAGCQRGGTPEVAGQGNVDIAGTYALATVDGASLPYRVSQEHGKPEVRNGEFLIRQDGTCRSRITFALPGRPEAVREVEASYARDGARLEMKWKGAGRTIGQVDGHTFAMTNEGVVFVYRR